MKLVLLIPYNQQTLVERKAAAMRHHNNRNTKKNASFQEATKSISSIPTVFKLLTKQRFFGVVLLLMCTVILMVAMQGLTPMERDATPVLLLIPLGIYMIFTKKNLLYSAVERGRGHGSSTGSQTAQRVFYQDHMGLS